MIKTKLKVQYVNLWYHWYYAPRYIFFFLKHHNKLALPIDSSSSQKYELACYLTNRLCSLLHSHELDSVTFKSHLAIEGLFQQRSYW